MKNHPVKAYSLWHGKNKFFFGGKIMVGPDFHRALVTFGIILCPEIVFVSTTSLYFNPSIPVISILLSLLSLFYLFQIATSNPGYIPRQEYPFTSGSLGMPTIYSALVAEPTKAAAIESPYFEFVINGSRTKIKYCRTCWITRPPRSSHCPDCDLCVEKFDHHCPWVGICVGKNNYTKFLAFISFTNALEVFNFVCCLTHIVLVSTSDNDDGQSGLNTFEKIGPSIFLGFFILLFLIFTGGLGFFHFYLVINGRTTNEVMKKSFKYNQKSPYSKENWWGNLMNLVSLKKTSVNLQQDILWDNKDVCNICISAKAFSKIGVMTEFENLEDQFKAQEKDSVSETPSIIHENIRVT